MPLDPFFAPFFAEPIRLFGDLGVEELRAEVRRRNITATPIHTSCSVTQFSAGQIPVRCYRPSANEAQSVAPAIVFFHGGGFVAGDLDTHDNLARILCHHTGCAVLSVDYRRPPEFRFPAAVDDAQAVLRWVVGSASTIRVDPAKIIFAGDSAGGNIAAGLAHDRSVVTPFGLILLYPVTDHYSGNHASLDTFADGYGLTTRGIRWFWDQYLPDEADVNDPRISPLRASDLSTYPPTLLVSAECDPLRDEGDLLAARLSSAGIAVHARTAMGMPHGFLRFAGQLAAVDAVVETIGDWTRSLLA